MSEVKVPCGGFTVNPNQFNLAGNELRFKLESLGDYGFMQGCYVTITENVDEETGIDQWRMSQQDVQKVISTVSEGLPVFAQIKTYKGADTYAYGVGNLCYFEKGKKLIFSCPYSEGTTFSIRFYDVSINSGIINIRVKELT